MCSLSWRLLSWQQVTTWAIYSRELLSLLLVKNPIVVVLSADFGMVDELWWDVTLLVKRKKRKGERTLMVRGLD